MSRLRTPLGALALCLLLTLPAHAQAAPEAPFAAEPAFEDFGPPVDASGDAPAPDCGGPADDRPTGGLARWLSTYQRDDQLMSGHEAAGWFVALDRGSTEHTHTTLPARLREQGLCPPPTAHH